MALELCIDSAAWILHAIDVGAPDTLCGLRLRRQSMDSQLGSPEVIRNDEPSHERCELDAAIKRAAANLPYDDAQALWLVDVCGHRYGTAAKEAGTSTGELADRVRSGREQIRADIKSSVSAPQRS